MPTGNILAGSTPRSSKARCLVGCAVGGDVEDVVGVAGESDPVEGERGEVVE